MELPAELTTRVPRGSFLYVPLTTNLYSWPARAPATSADQYPFHDPPGVSLDSVVEPQPLNVPLMVTVVAFGAHVRKVTPVPLASA